MPPAHRSLLSAPMDEPPPTDALTGPLSPTVHKILDYAPDELQVFVRQPLQ